MLAAVALAGLMQEADAGDGTGAVSGGAVPAAEDTVPTSSTTIEEAKTDTAPQAEAVPEVDAIAEAAASGAPKVAIVRKGNESIPVQLKHAAHLEELRREHGAGNVEVQS